MIPVLGCETTRGMLHAFMDGELTIAEQVALEAHLRWCRTCAAHVDDLRIIGDSLRLWVPTPNDEDPALDALQARVVSRRRAERDLCWTTCVRHAFEDLHVVWAAAGATAGVLACLLLTVGVIAETDERASDSLACRRGESRLRGSLARGASGVVAVRQDPQARAGKSGAGLEGTRLVQR